MKVSLTKKLKKKIFICCAYHENDLRIKTKYVTPVHLGRAIASNALRSQMSDMIGDNTGDNISHLNQSFCDLTAIYWMMKNVDAEYYGLMHYRRIFNLGPFTYINGLPFGGKLNKDFHYNIEQYDKSIENLIDSYDIIVTSETRKLLDIEFLDKISKYFAESFPNSFNINVSNMFIMKKDIFQEVWGLLFKLCFDIFYANGKENFNVNKKRALVNPAEDGFGIIINYLKRRTKYKILTRPFVFLKEFLGYSFSRSYVKTAEKTAEGKEFLDGVSLEAGEDLFRLRLLTSFHIANKNYSEALVCLDMVESSRKYSGYILKEYAFQRGYIYYKQNLFEASIPLFLVLISSYGSHHRDKELIDKIIFLTNENSDFLEKLITALKKSKIPETLKNTLLLLMYHSNKSSDKVLQLADEIDEAPWWMNITYIKAVALKDKKKYDDSFHSFTQFIIDAPGTWEVRLAALEIGSLSIIRNDFVDNFLSFIRKIDMSEIYKNLLRLEFFRARNDHEKTIEIADLLLEADNTIRYANLYMGIAFRKKGELEKAMFCFDSEEKLRGESPDIFVQKSIVYRLQCENADQISRSEKINAAKKMIQQGLELSPNIFWLNSEMGWLCEMDKSFEEALYYFKNEDVIQPKNEIVKANINRIKSFQSR